MHRPQPRLGETDAGQQGGQGHLFPPSGGALPALIPGQQAIAHRLQRDKGLARGCGISWSSVTQRHPGARRRPAMEFAATVMLAAIVLYLLTQAEDLAA